MRSSSHDLGAELKMNSFTVNWDTFSNEERVAAVVPVTSVEVSFSEAILSQNLYALLVKCLMKILGRSALWYMVGNILGGYIRLLLSKQLHRRLRRDAPVVKSQGDHVLPSTALTTPRLWGGWSQSGRVWVPWLLGAGSEEKRRYSCLLPKTVRGPEIAPDTPYSQRFPCRALTVKN